jgi:hypothetical protein
MYVDARMRCIHVCMWMYVCTHVYCMHACTDAQACLCEHMRAGQTGPVCQAWAHIFVRMREAPNRLLWNTEAICSMVIVALLFNVFGINTWNMLDVMKRGLCQSEAGDSSLQPQVPSLTRPVCLGPQGTLAKLLCFWPRPLDTLTRYTPVHTP